MCRINSTCIRGGIPRMRQLSPHPLSFCHFLQFSATQRFTRNQQQNILFNHLLYKDGANRAGAGGFRQQSRYADYYPLGPQVPEEILSVQHLTHGYTDESPVKVCLLHEFLCYCSGAEANFDAFLTRPCCYLLTHCVFLLLIVLACQKMTLCRRTSLACWTGASSPNRRAILRSDVCPV